MSALALDAVPVTGVVVIQLAIPPVLIVAVKMRQRAARLI